ncbi:E3 ubiquitin protein ligase DRIP2-like [Solanum stenotomum]|uniref:E3 ubiquitin protein ligase DRIP2-like n=1 Tax=Solanum stenotomum TaxID=172797 RepID=UPI0020D0D9C5|nr:E3 ubiquitin protein ligase DRIP2-like [Solanum stenotomum]
MDDFHKRLASLKSVLTCRICKKLCKDVTIIEECCHRFCKKCITRKISKGKWNVCPECSMDLGVAPLHKLRPDHQLQGIRDIFSSKRRELIELGLIEKSKKNKSKKLAREDIDLNYSAEMLIDPSPLPAPAPAPVVIATSSRRKEKLISSIVNITPLVDDQVSNQDNVSSSNTRRGKGRGRGRRRGSSQNNANDVDLSNGDTHLGSLIIPLLSSKDALHKQQVESIAYAAESSKKNKSIEPLDGINDLWEPLNKLVTKGDTLDNSEEPVPKFISSTPQFNLDNYENEEDNDDDEEDDEYVPSPNVKEHKVRQQNAVKKIDVVQAIEAPSSSNNNNIDKGKGKKGRRGRKKKETNNPLSPLPVSGGGDGGGGTNLNVAQVQVAIEAEGGTISGSTRVVNERVHPIWFTLVACDKQACSLPLPQISSRYIKIKDVNKSSSYIKKYLAHKLSLQSEDEVEIHMLGMQIQPTFSLKNLAELWLRVGPNSGKNLAKVGASAQEFVMVLNYSRAQLS